MSESVVIAVAGNVVTLLVAIGGWLVTYLMHRQVRRLAQLQNRVTRLEVEVRARIALEKAACTWLAAETCRTPEAIKRDLRSRTQEYSGLRPKLAESDLTT